MTDTQVLIVGAGPVGLTLALDLGRRGVRCTLIERNTIASQLPKMERCNARTMEIYRRLGIAEQVRDAGLPRDAPMDVFLALSMADPALAHLPCPSVARAKTEIAARNDGGLLEPYQLISQYTLEPLLRSIVETLPTVTLRFGCELISFEQDTLTVTASILKNGNAQEIIHAKYLVGCDGGSSAVRKQLGIQLQGEGNIRKMRQALFRCDDLYERIPMGRGRHYHIAEGPLFPFLILQDSTRHWTLHAAASSDAEMAEIFRKSLAMPVDFEMLSVNEWTQHLLCAERYSDGCVFIAGDAAHLVIPTGGLGMNTGVGDAVDLSWKLAATLAGWGGPNLLASYEAERRPIGLRNVKASRAAMTGRLGWRAAYHPDVRENSAEGATTRERMAALFDTEQRKVTEISGIEAGYLYADSPIVWPESGDRPDPDNPTYVPTTSPGARLPHVWLDGSSGTDLSPWNLATPIPDPPATNPHRPKPAPQAVTAALHDRLGPGFTLLRLGGTRADTSRLEQSFQGLRAPLEVLEVSSPKAREIFQHDLILVRPDLHVAWRGSELPRHPEKIAMIATGQVQAHV